jgi:hypothetical protein
MKKLRRILMILKSKIAHKNIEVLIKIIIY